MPSAILFDIGNTILLPHRNDYAAAMRDLFAHAVNPCGISAAEFARVFEELYGDIDARRGASLLEIPITTFQRLLFERLDLTFGLPAEDVAWLFWQLAETLSPMPGVHEALGALAARGIRLAALSNTPVSAEIVRRELACHGLLDYFAFVMVSSEYGVRKPHRAIFLTAAGKLHLPPGDVWYVGDNYDLDVVGAAGAGMVPVWLNHQGVAIPAGAPEGLRSIGTLGELAGLR